MTPGTQARVIAGPYLRQHDTTGWVAHHHPTDPFIPVMVRDGDAVVRADLLPHELEQVTP